MQNKAVNRVHRNTELPLLPLDGMAIDVKTCPFRLRNRNRLWCFTQGRLVLGLVAAVFRWKFDHAVIFQENDFLVG